jgi:hypothetical protein
MNLRANNEHHTALCNERVAHHLMLAQSANVMSTRATKWRLLVRASKLNSMKTKVAKETSTTRRKVGCKLEPGVRILARKESSTRVS